MNAKHNLAVREAMAKRLRLHVVNMVAPSGQGCMQPGQGAARSVMQKLAETLKCCVEGRAFVNRTNDIMPLAWIRHLHMRAIGQGARAAKPCAFEYANHGAG